MASAPSFRFVHAADLHLDTPFRGLGTVAPAIAAALREASLEALERVVDLALDHDAAFLLVAGDVYDGPWRGLRAQRRFVGALGRLSAAGIDSFVVHGNHDPEGGWSAIGRWPDRVTVFPAGAVGLARVVRDGTQLATVQGISYGRRAETENLARHLQRPDEAGLHIGLLHCAVAGASDGHAPYSPCTLADLRATRLDYLALGHVHRRSVLADGVGQPWVVYPGSTQARSLHLGEVGPKGAVVVEVREGVVDEVRFEPCDAVRLVSIDVGIEPHAGIGELADALEAAALEQRDVARRPVVVKARLVGTGPLHADLARPAAIEDLLATVRADLPDDGWFCWLSSIVDDTRPPLDLAAMRARDDFAGDLVRLADQLASDPGALAMLLDEAGALPRPLAGLAAAGPPSADTLGKLLERARSVALEALQAGAPQPRRAVQTAG